MGKKIGIIGAGVGGLLACKHTLSKGHYPVVFESESKIGGVWTKTIETTKLQSHKSVYQFSDFPWPSSVAEDYPHAHQVLSYIESYARHFNLMEHIRFNSKAVSISYVGSTNDKRRSWTLWSGTGEAFANGGTWDIVVQDTQTHSTEVFQVDFVILCLGQFSGVPNIPEFPMNKGPEVYDGQVIHSLDYASMDNATAANFTKGKRVTVIGFQKSALDIAMETSKANGAEQPCTILCRTPRWKIPEDGLPWAVTRTLVYPSRLFELLVHKPGQGWFLNLLAMILSPLRWAISKFAESYIKRKLRLVKYGMVPDHSLLKELNSCLISIIPKGFYDNVDKGSIIIKKSPSFTFCKEGLLLEGETIPVRTDLVILATGFKGEQKLKDIMGSSNHDITLYRQCILPRIPQLAVIGYSESFSTLYNTEVRCRWLAELFDGIFKLPSIITMERDITKWEQFMKQSYGNDRRKSCIGALHIWYNDQLCKDMGWNPRRKKGFLADLFQPYGPLDYAQR